MFKKLLFFSFIFINFSLKATSYYVDDATANDANDLYSTGATIGNNANNGLTTSTPKLTLANLWATYGPSGTNVIVAGDVIYVDAGTYTSASAVSGTCNCGFTINIAITIQGAGATKTIFDNNYVGIAGSYYFANLTASVTIKDLQLKKYASNQNGQAIQISGTGSPGVTLTNVLLNSNGGSSRYASIYVGSNSTVNINGGGQQCNGDASHNASGGIDVVGTSIVLNITSVVFANNYKSSSAAVGHGAALSITGANSTTDVTLTNCLFSGNQTDNDAANGGAIYATTGDLILTDCIIENSDTYENSVKYGGAAYFTGGTQLFTRVLVRNNTNSGGSTYGTVSVNGGALTLTNCYFSGNTSDRGKDIYCKSGSITATNTTFGSAVNQTATYGGTITLTNCGTSTNQYSSGTYTNNGGAAPAFTTPTTPSFSGVCGSIVSLPVDLLTFSAEKQLDNSVNLEWITLTEINNNFFTIKKSLDGTEWTEIARENGSGTSHAQINYSIHDRSEMAEIVYYQLSQVDFDGKKVVFDPISIRFKMEKGQFHYVNMMGQIVNVENGQAGIYLQVFENGEVTKVLNY